MNPFETVVKLHRIAINPDNITKLEVYANCVWFDYFGDSYKVKCSAPKRDFRVETRTYAYKWVYSDRAKQMERALLA